MSQLRWKPSEDFKNQSNLSQYMHWLNASKGLSFSDYQELWHWSVNHVDDFWESLWLYFDVLRDGTYTHVKTGNMPTVSWFEGTRVNYAEHIFRKATDHYPAILFKSESKAIQTVSWKELEQQVASLQSYFKTCGVKEGDRVVAYMPCVPEATVAFLATSSLGAIWSSCSPDFGTNAVIDRFAQIEPTILITTNRYEYGGKSFDKTEVVEALIEALPSLKYIVLVSSTQQKFNTHKKVDRWEDVIKGKDQTLEFTRVPFQHPLWVLYSSGTTGLPKAITHSHGGILLEQLKYATFHNDYKSGERCFWYTTTGWMMWNYIHGSLLTGSTMVLYDGSPAYPDLLALWKFIDDANIHHFGTSAGFILANMKTGIKPSKHFTLNALRSIGSTGSTLPPEGFDWIYDHVKKDCWLTSMSGGTDICSAFVGGNPMWPVYAGEIQCRALGCKLEAFTEEGKPIEGEVGEMVITEPMPSMPIYFWNDPDFKRYTESYFNFFPTVWRHGDWIELTPQQGVIIYGRSDATLNRGGIRIGTSEIYRALDQVSEVKDSLIICLEKKGGEFWMPLFVVMGEGVLLTDEIKKKINTTIRKDYTPRHVPDEIIEVTDIPYTISGKKTETPVKKVLMGHDPKIAVNVGTLRNPKSMNFFIALARDISR